MVAKLGLVKVLNLPQNFCFQGTAGDILLQIASLLAVELPESITNVHVGPDAPVDPQTIALWVRQDGAGNFVGLYVFSDGAWEEIGAYEDWISTYSGNSGMTFTGVSGFTRSSRVGDTVNVNMRALGTVGGTLSTQLIFTLPAPCAVPVTIYLPIRVVNAGADADGVLQLQPGSSNALVTLAAGGNWSAGSGGLFASFTYEAQ